MMNRRHFLESLTQGPLVSALRRALLGFGLLAPATQAADAAACCGNSPDASAPKDAVDSPAVAFYYGDDIPFDELGAFDWVVLEPAHALAQVPDVAAALGPRTTAFAYVSVGEVTPDRPYFGAMPEQWLATTNKAWQSRVIDQTASGWPQFLRDRIVAPLWKAGFRAFFLDTLDSYQLLAKTDAARQQQADALRTTLHGLIAAFPGIRLMLNRGFELVDTTLAPAVSAVAAESVYRGWQQSGQAYVEVGASDREWLLQRFTELRSRFSLPGIAIDYCPAQQRALARQTAQRIAAHGLIPWVADPRLESLGVGAVEVVPRHVLLLHSCADGDSPALQAQSAHIYGAMPLEHLGLVPQYRYIGASATTKPLAGRYAAIVLYPDDSDVPPPIQSLLMRAKAEQVPVVILGAADADVLSAFGAQLGQSTLSGPLSVQRQPGTPNGEIIPLINPVDTVPLAAGPGAQVWLRASGADGQTMDGAAITPWGGYALGAFGVFNLPGDNGTRWSIDPIAFFRAALRVGDDPMPDITTRTGRRAFFVHFDGDGWPNACDRPGSPLAGQLLVTEILETYRVPTVGSIIVGEVSDDGEYPATAEDSQKWARRMYALPWVEAGSHTWSHPFDWVKASEVHARFPTAQGYEKIGNYLPLPNYTFSSASNITGAKEYIEKHLCPPGKTCDIILWPGDCNPPNKAVAMAYQAGMANLNGGGATITRSQPTLSNVWPMGIPKGEYFQVYAACSNEEDYTHNWKGPYFGFERVIESYQMTDSPRRVKPIDLYYHPYIVTRAAGLKSLHTVYRWVLAQPVHPIFGRQYVHSVNAWRRATVARRLAGGWRLRSSDALRQWAQPDSAAEPRLDASRGIAGWNLHAGRRYLHATAGEAVVLAGGAPGAPRPRLVEANADVVRWEAAGAASLQVRLQGHVPVETVIHLPTGWTLRASSAAKTDSTSDGLRVRGTGTALDLTLRRA